MGDIIEATIVEEEVEGIHTDIAEVQIVPAITETSNFQRVLLEIPMKVSKANDLLESYREDPELFLESYDEDEINSQIKDMEEVSKFVRNVEKARKEIRSYMNGIRDNIIANLDDRLEASQYTELEKAQGDIKQLKKDLDADRRAKRWEEIKQTSEANINRYPLIGEFAPELADFSRFKMINPKLISGARTRTVREKDHVFVNETIYNWNTALEIIKENEWALSAYDLGVLLNMFKQNPSIELVDREGRQLKANAEAKEKARIEAEKRRKEQEERMKLAEKKRQEELAKIQEKERLAKLQRDTEAQKKAEADRLELERKKKEALEREKELRREFLNFGGQYKVIFKESFPKFMEYLFDNPAYHDVHTNPATKANIIYDIMHQIDDLDSVVTKETNKDPQKVLDLVRYILDA